MKKKGRDKEETKEDIVVEKNGKSKKNKKIKNAKKIMKKWGDGKEDAERQKPLN